MKPAAFIRHVPKTLDEAVKILAEVAPQDGRVLAGGQSLVPIMAFRLAKPAHLVDINEVAGLDRITNDGKVTDASARACATAPSTSRSSTGRSAPCSRPSCAISRIIRSACAARSAAAWRMPIRPRNGASPRRRSTRP